MIENLNLNFFIYSISTLLFLIFFKYSELIGNKTGLIDKNKVPVLGGIYLFIGFILNYIVSLNELVKYDLIVDVYFISAVFLIALLDDKLDLNAYLRIILLSIIIIFFVYKNDLFIYSINSKYFGFFYFPNNIIIKFLFPTFCIIVLLNAFNFTDGINCLASLIGISWLFYLIIKMPIIYEVYLVFLLFIIVNSISLLNFELSFGSTISTPKSLFIAKKLIFSFFISLFIFFPNIQCLLCFHP